MFLDEGIPVIDTDKIARDLFHHDTVVYQNILEQFGQEILLTDHTINRKKLGKIVFANKQKRDILNQIVHPHVYSMVDKEIELFEELGKSIIVLDIPLLFETGYQDKCDKTIVVYTSKEQQLERLMERDGINEEFAHMKISAQMPLSEKCEIADYVIDNSHSILQTKKDFNHILSELEVT
jgi:dephospho-CoA kinase